MKIKLLTNMLVLAAAFAAAPITASAAAVVCGDLSLGTRTTTVDPAMSCVGAGLGNLGNTALEGLSYVDDVIERDNANTNGGLLSITGEGGYSGTWTFASSLWDAWDRLFLYFHFGNVTGQGATYDPDYFIVELARADFTGSWVVNPGNRGALSNVALMGGGGGNTVPEPASLALLGIGLLGLGAARRLRKTA